MNAISKDTGIQMLILGGDLQLEGITTNQSFSLDERDKPVYEVLMVIAKKASPSGKLLYVIKQLNGLETLVLTTRAAAASRGDLIPAIFVPAASGSRKKWSELMDPAVFKAELAESLGRLETAVSSATKFKSTSYRDARASLSWLATLVALLDQGDPFEDAGTVRRRLLQAAGECKVGTDKSLSEAKARLGELQKWIADGYGRGPVATFSAPTGIADFSQLMKRMEAAQLRLTRTATASTANQPTVLQDAQVIAVLSQVIQLDERARDPAFVSYAVQLQEAALNTINAGQNDDPQQTRQSLAAVSHSCVKCHHDFR